MVIDNVRVVIENGTFSAEDAQYYINKIKRSKRNLTLKSVTFSLTDDYLDIRYSFAENPFERLRRISFEEMQEEIVVNN